jgi:putative transposase
VRWASDGFDIPCLDRQVVRVSFALDTCDGEVWPRCVSIWEISGEMIRDLILEAGEKLFAATATPHQIQWLCDSGSPYRAYEMADLAVRLGLVPCFSPVCSPQSNGMAEAFAKTFKRNYNYVHDHPDAQTVVSHVLNWFWELQRRPSSQRPAAEVAPRVLLQSHTTRSLSCRIGVTPVSESGFLKQVRKLT